MHFLPQATAEAGLRLQEGASRPLPFPSRRCYLQGHWAGSQLQQRQSAHLQSTHLQHAQVLFSTVDAFITFSWNTAGCRGTKVEP